MNLRLFLAVLKARYKVAVFVLLSTVAVAIAATEYLPKQYVASTSLVVDSMNRDPVAAMLLPGSLGTQMDIIRSDRVAKRVVHLMKLDQSPGALEGWRKATKGQGAIEDWLAGLLLKSLTVKPGGDGNVINIEYRAADPGFAAAVANAFAQAYMDVVIELKVDPAKQFARWFGEQGKTLRENLEKAQARLSEYQQEKGIVGNDGRVDTETARLAALTAQLTTIQEQTVDARSRQRSATSDNLPEVLSNPVIVALRGDIARQEARLKDAAVNLGRNHPKYLRMQSELAELKANLKAEIERVTRSFAASRSVGRDKENALKAAIAAQKRKVLRLKSEHDRVTVLQRDVDAAQRAYNAVTTRYNQANLESQATQTNVSVLTPAVAPLVPLFPKPLRVMVIVSLVLGIALAVGAALGLEFLDRRIRSADDLAEMLQMPVLGVIHKGGKSRPFVAALPRPRAPLALK